MHFLIRNCEYCMQIKDEKTAINVMRDYEKFLGVKLVNEPESFQEQFNAQNENDSQNNNDDEMALKQIGLEDLQINSSSNYYNDFPNERNEMNQPEVSKFNGGADDVVYFGGGGGNEGNF